MKNELPKSQRLQRIRIANVSIVFRNQANEGIPNIFLIQNKGKGPPGRICIPELVYGSIRDNQPVTLPSNFIFNEIELYKHIKPEFISQLNFTIMKKQILFLGIFILTALASITNTFGQAQPSTILPRPLTGCNDYPLHPLPGKAYDYQVTNTAGPAPSTYTWWATKDPNFLTATATANTSNMLSVGAGELIATSANYGGANATSTVSITWSPEILAKTLYQGPVGTDPSPTFVVVKADGSCTNNLQVYEINPLKAFTVDISTFDATASSTVAYGATATSCVDIARGAKYVAATHDLLMDYGTNTITYEVIAANFVTNWRPTFQIMSGLTASQTATIGWAYTEAASAAGTFVDSSAPGLQTGGVWAGTQSVTTNETNTVKGVSIWVTVVIKNNTYESLTDQPFTLAVDGVDSTGQWDLTAVCANGTAADQNDQATHVITARPTIGNGTADPGPNPATFVPKQ